MNTKHIEKMIPIAMEEIKSLGIIQEDGKIPSKYFGYLASFGPAIIQSGVLQAITYYSEKSNESDRITICNLVYNVLSQMEFIKPQDDDASGDLKSYYTTNISEVSSQAKQRKWRNRIMETITACKLALNTFPKTSPVEENGETE